MTNVFLYKITFNVYIKLYTVCDTLLVHAIYIFCPKKSFYSHHTANHVFGTVRSLLHFCNSIIAKIFHM